MRFKHLAACALLAVVLVSGARAAEQPPIEFRVGPFPAEARDWMSEALVDEPALSALGGGKIPDALDVFELDADGKTIGTAPVQMGPDSTPWRNPNSTL